jgi:hypothetical protein
VQRMRGVVAPSLPRTGRASTMLDVISMIGV